MQKVALVTGGSRGIGRAISCILKESGFTVISTHKSNTEAAKAFSSETAIPSYQVDVTQSEQVNSFVADVENKYGPIAVLVNNAGITADKMFHKMDECDFDNVINTNLKSCYVVTKAVINGMRERQSGRIVNISSVNALSGQLGQANYSASKAGIIGFTKSLALENARKGITVNAVAPGYTKTEMLEAMPQNALDGIISKIPAGRLADAKEIAYAVEYLCSDKASYITGTTISINGGLYL